MNESDFENELRQFQPAPCSDVPRTMVARTLHQPSPLADRVLATFITSGAAAAVLILTLHAIDFLERPAPPPTSQQSAQQSMQESLAQRQELLGELAGGDTLALNR